MNEKILNPLKGRYVKKIGKILIPIHDIIPIIGKYYFEKIFKIFQFCKSK